MVEIELYVYCETTKKGAVRLEPQAVRFESALTIGLSVGLLGIHDLHGTICCGVSQPRDGDREIDISTQFLSMTAGTLWVGTGIIISAETLWVEMGDELFTGTFCVGMRYHPFYWMRFFPIPVTFLLQFSRGNIAEKGPEICL